jgi:hypothetical protein
VSRIIAPEQCIVLWNRACLKSQIICSRSATLKSQKPIDWRAVHKVLITSSRKLTNKPGAKFWFHPVTNSLVGCSFPVEQIIRWNRLYWGYCWKTKMRLRRSLTTCPKEISQFLLSNDHTVGDATFTLILCSNCMLWLSWWPQLTFTTLHKLSVPTYQWNNNVILLPFSVVGLRSLKIMNCVVSNSESEPSESKTAFLFTYTRTGDWNTENICNLGSLQSMFLTNTLQCKGREISICPPCKEMIKLLALRN